MSNALKTPKLIFTFMQNTRDAAKVVKLSIGSNNKFSDGTTTISDEGETET